jgi:hypothetical protein
MGPNKRCIKIIEIQVLGNKSQSKQLSDTDSIALTDLIVDFVTALTAIGGAIGISLTGLSLLSGGNPQNSLSQMRSFIQGDFTSCTAASGDLGYCASLINCNMRRGISSGACPNGGVCCTSKIVFLTNILVGFSLTLIGYIYRHVDYLQRYCPIQQHLLAIAHYHLS